MVEVWQNVVIKGNDPIKTGTCCYVKHVKRIRLFDFRNRMVVSYCITSFYTRIAYIK